MAFVVDASVVAAWFLSDEQNEIADKALERMEFDDAIAPNLLPHEIRNILLSAERRKRIDQDAIFSILLRFNTLPLSLVSGGDHVAIIQLSKKHALSAYDAAYLSIAVAHGIPLATNDKKLAAAAIAENVAFG